MQRLIEGYRQFRRDVWPENRARYEALSRDGQRPHTMVIACSDSRVDPATVFGLGPGELFSVRNVAGLVPIYQPDAGYHGTSAALEFGVRVLKVARVVVLGHAQCGGVRAMVEGAPAEARDFVEPWMAIAEPVRATLPPSLDPETRLALGELAVVRLSVANLMSFPWIAEAVASGTMSVHGLRFDIHTGVLASVDPDGLTPIA